MNPLEVDRKLCLGGRAVPLVERELEFEDIFQVGGDLDEQMFECLSLKASMDPRWLQSAFKLSTKWWAMNSSKVPLIQEIREIIDSGKAKKGAAKRLSRKADVVVAINVRGHQLLVLNTVLPVTLCWPQAKDDGDQGIETLEWFVSEFKKDLEGMQISKKRPFEPSQGSSGRPTKAKASNKEQGIINDTLDSIKEHPQCKTVHFLPTRSSIKIIKKDKKVRQFPLKGLGNKRKKALDRDDDEQAWGELQSIFDQIVPKAIGFLNGEEDIEPETVEEEGDTQNS